MSLYNYVDPPNPNLVCCICRAPFMNPTTAAPCAHTFCAECIEQALAHAPTCPVDRAPLSVADLAPANPIVRSLVDELMVECVHQAEGCAAVVQRQSLAAHLREECVCAQVRCEEVGCEAELRRGEMPRHLREVHGEDGEEKEEEKEKEKELQQERCAHAALGCTYEGAQDEHMKSCAYEALKGFFTANERRMGLLSEQNVLLRRRVETLEGTVGHLKKELAQTRATVAPWVGAGDFGGATLEGTIAGLREGITGVSAGIEGVARRGELALANETLRLGEEMMSVRQQMHGLRMQVHGLLVERSAQEAPYAPLVRLGGSVTKL